VFLLSFGFGPCLVPKYFGQNIKFFAILHFGSKHALYFGPKLFAKLNRDIGLV
jgi:hypothetical protein